MTADGPAIRYQDRLFLTGMTGCGKSTVARALFLSAAAPRLVIDPADSALTMIPGSVTVRGPRDRHLRGTDVERAVLRALAPHAAADTVRFVPGNPARREEYDAAYVWAFAHYPRYVWLDEAGLAAPANGCPPALAAYLVQGRKRQLGHLAAHTRPVDVAVDLYAQASHVLMWTLPHADDRKRLAATLGVTSADLSDALAGLERVPGGTATGFAWWDVRAQTLTVCPPLAP